MRAQAVFFDVDFTLIYPGPTFQGAGYRDFCDRFHISVDESRFGEGVASAASLLEVQNETYDAEIFVQYAAHIIMHMGGTGDQVLNCAREIYREWAACQHFELYDEVPAVLRALTAAGVRVGLISNSHRCLASFESHFELNGLIAGAVASSEHGYMKPHPSIFNAALQLLDVAPSKAVMVGDSVRQDVEGALGVGMSAVLLHRGSERHPLHDSLAVRGVPVVRSLLDVRHLLLE